jgi:hypothetical protein
MFAILTELLEWTELDLVREVRDHEDYDDVVVYVSKSLEMICVRRDESGEIIEAWMEY